MRLDKFLKLSRLVKRRPIANKLAEMGKVQVNGKQVKPAYKVAINDEISIDFEHRQVRVRIISLDKKDFNKDGTMFELL